MWQKQRPMASTADVVMTTINRVLLLLLLMLLFLFLLFCSVRLFLSKKAARRGEVNQLYYWSSFLLQPWPTGIVVVVVAAK
jgi:hypothetical protein